MNILRFPLSTFNSQLLLKDEPFFWDYIFEALAREKRLPKKNGVEMMNTATIQLSRGIAMRLVSRK